MASLFLSYAREDTAFVQRLYAALERQGFGLWVDWEGIPPADDWLRRIGAAIEQSDAVVFVISDDSLLSPVCQQELAHASERHKRILPVVAREPSSGALASPGVHEAVRRLNWIFFSRPQDDFDAATALLAQAARTDLPWVETHTRLLQRALEWEAGARDESHLLVKTELAAAEAWLASAPDKEPAPTRQHTEYIVSGRAAAARRQRRRTVLMGVAAGLIGLGAVIATWQFLLAELRRQDALSRQLAAAAPAVVDQDPALGLLLAAHAAAASPTLEASQSLQGVLERVRGVEAFVPGRFQPHLLALSADGAHLAATRCEVDRGEGCERTRIELWQLDPPALRAVGQLPMAVEGLVFTGQSAALQVLACCADAPDGRRRVLRLDPPSGPVAPAAAPPALVTGSDTGLRQGDRWPTAFDPSAPQTNRAAPERPARTLQGIGNADELIAQEPLRLRLAEVGPAGRPIAELSLGLAEAYELRLRADGAFAAGLTCEVGGSGRLCGRVVLGLIDAAGPEPQTLRRELPWPEWAHDVVLVPGVPMAISGGCGWHDQQRCQFGELRLWLPGAGDNQPAPIRVPGDDVRSMAISDSGRRLAVLTGQGVLSVWRLDPARLARLGRFDPAFAGEPATASPAAPEAPLTCQGEPIPEVLKPIARRLKDPAAVCATLPEVDALWPERERQRMGPMAPRLEVARAPGDDRFAAGGCVDGDAGDGAACMRGRAVVWSIQEGLLVRLAALDLGSAVQRLAFSGDGATLAIAHCAESREGVCREGVLEIVRLRDTPAALQTLATGLSSVSALALDTDGGHVAVGLCARRGASGGGPGPCALGRIELRRTALPDATPLWTQEGHDSSVDFLRFDPAGDRLVSAAWNGSVGLWSVREGDRLGPVIETPLTALDEVGFAPDGGLQLRSRPHDGTPAMQLDWPVHAAHWQAAACRLAQRPLTEAERRRHLTDADMPDPCRADGVRPVHRFWRWLRASRWLG